MTSTPNFSTSSGLTLSSQKTGTITLQSGNDVVCFGIRTILSLSFSGLFLYGLSQGPVIFHNLLPERSRMVSEEKNVVRAHRPNACVDNDCERKSLEIFDESNRKRIHVSSDSEGSKCKCEGDHNSDRCTCSDDCTFIEHIKLCTDLLGKCECGRQEDAMLCECWGFCLHTEDRERACHEEWGCSWNGVTCDVQEFDQFLIPMP